jgi:hypothetical protein
VVQHAELRQSRKTTALAVGISTVARMSAATCGTADPHVAEFIIGRAFARPVGSCGLRAFNFFICRARRT